MAALVNPTNPNADGHSNDLQSAARKLGIELHILHASSERDFDTVFTSLVQTRASALVIGSDAFYVSRIKQLGALTARHAVPAIYQFREFVEAGGLLSYGSSITDTYRLVGVYTVDCRECEFGLHRGREASGRGRMCSRNPNGLHPRRRNGSA
jgi:ABC-type uncharacterized transport system substrate-binding protein